MNHTVTTERMSTISSQDIIRNKRSALANLTLRRALGFATQDDLARIKELQNEIDQLQREADIAKYARQS